MKNLQELKRSKMIFSLIFLACFLFVSSCGGGGTPPPHFPPKASPPVAEKKEVTPVREAEKAERQELAKKEEIEFTYDPAGKPDPFIPFIQLSPSDKRRDAFLTPLQKYDLSQLKLVAIIVVPDGNIALIEDSLGKGYFLRIGTLIGKNDGKVKSILKDRVIVEEVYQDVIGKRKVNEISLILRRTEEGGES